LARALIQNPRGVLLVEKKMERDAPQLDSENLAPDHCG